MQSKAATVDEYLKEVPVERLKALTQIRELCLKELKGYKEIMRYGGPCYEKIISLRLDLPVRKIFCAPYQLHLCL